MGLILWNEQKIRLEMWICSPNTGLIKMFWHSSTDLMLMKRVEETLVLLHNDEGVFTPLFSNMWTNKSH